MKLQTTFRGGDQPFEGDRTLELLGLPVDAQIVRGAARVIPLPSGQTVSLGASPANPWGVTREGGTVDFHARRVVSQVRIPSTTSGTVHVQIDIGGVWVTLNNDGTLAVPQDGKNREFAVANGVVNTRDVITSRLQVTQGANPLQIEEVAWHSLPTNVSLRIGEQGPFWFQIGDLRMTATTPDFTEPLRAYLRSAQAENGHAIIPFTIHSDAIARLELVLEVEYLRQQALLPAGVREVILPFAYEPLPQVDSHLLAVALPPSAQIVPGMTTARAIGTFEASRIVFGPTLPVSPAAVIRVASDCSQAQPIQVPTDLAVTALDLLLEPLTEPAILSVTLLADADGKPFGEALLPRSVNIRLEQEVGTGLRWVSAPLPAEFQFKARGPDGRSSRYWLVVNSAEGEGNWAVLPQTDDRVGVRCSQDNGLSWQATEVRRMPGPLAGLFRLRHTPAQFQVPIQLQIGQGNETRRLSLDHFRPLGRVDFALDFPEVADAFNQYLKDATPTPCPEGEHLANGDFDQWIVVGDTIMRPRPIPVNGSPTAVAIGPDGRWAYVGSVSTENEMPTAHLQFVDVACDLWADEVPLRGGVSDSTPTPNVIAVHPDGTRAYVVTQDGYLHVIDTTIREELGAPVSLRGGVRSLALTPNGQRLYVTEYFNSATDNQGAVRDIDTARLEQVVRGTLSLEQAVVGTIDIGLRQEPIALTAILAGNNPALIYVLIVDHDAADNSQVRVVDSATDTLLGAALIVGKNSSGMAVAPDGRWALVTHAEDNTVSVIDIARGTVEGSSIAVGNTPMAVAVSPDGVRAFVTNSQDATLSVIDLTRRTVAEPIVVGPSPMALAITPQGDRVYVVNAGSRLPSSPPSLASIPVGVRMPAEWALTSGWVEPVCFPDPFHLVAVLELSPQTRKTMPTALSQTVPVVASCRYDFSFWGLSTQTGSMAEVLWLSQECGLLRTDPMPIVVWERRRTATAIEGFLRGRELPGTRFLASGIRAAGRVVPQQPQLVLHRVQLTAPEGATQAEVRFSVSPGGAAAIDMVSLMATAEVVTNGDLHLQQEGRPANWTLSPIAAPGVSLVVSENGVQLRNGGTNTAALAQTVPVIANQPFVLEFQGQAVAGPLAQLKPQVELHWQKSDGSSAGANIVQPITPVGFDRYLVEGMVPATATQAQVRLAVPPGATLEASRISLHLVQHASVPITFLAQSRGELSVSEARVTYDLTEVRPPPVPSTGLCTPTPPGQKPGTRPEDRCFCPCCETEGPLRDTAPVVTPAGRPAVVGLCRECGSKLVRLGGQLIGDADPLSLPQLPTRLYVVPPAVIRPTPAAPVETSTAEVADMPPLTAIYGIGELRAQRLAESGIDSIEKLAARSPQEVAQVLRGVSVEMAARFIDEARGS